MHVIGFLEGIPSFVFALIIGVGGAFATSAALKILRQSRGRFKSAPVAVLGILLGAVPYVRPLVLPYSPYGACGVMGDKIASASPNAFDLPSSLRLSFRSAAVDCAQDAATFEYIQRLPEGTSGEQLAQWQPAAVAAICRSADARAFAAVGGKLYADCHLEDGVKTSLQLEQIHCAS